MFCFISYVYYIYTINQFIQKQMKLGKIENKVYSIPYELYIINLSNITILSPETSDMIITQLTTTHIQAENITITIVLTLSITMEGIDLSYLYRNFIIQFDIDTLSLSLNEHTCKYEIDDDGISITRPFIAKYFDIMLSDYFSEFQEDQQNKLQKILFEIIHTRLIDILK